MWLAGQLNSFLNLGECKEYSIMARSKSIPGGKTNRSNKEKPVTNSAGESSEVKTIAAESIVAEHARESAAEKVTTEAKVTPTLRANSEPRKMEVMKTDSRKNLVPINLEDEIRRRAYELYQQRGSASANEADDWLAAEREVRQRYRQQSA
jgi:Protein of unknown function (DUF2934)